MSEPEKPFACVVPDCRMTFTNEDHLHVHTKKHDIALQLALGQKGVAFDADQTPTPTRFIRNCEEVGLFQDLQNVNPFDETFKRAMEARLCSSSLEPAASMQGDDVLHTPHIFPHLSEDSPSGGFSSSGQKSTETTETTDSTVETCKDKDSQTSTESTSAKAVCTVTTAQKHNLAVQKGLLTHRVEASLQLPVISISESDDSSIEVHRLKMRYQSRLVKDDILLTCVSRANLESLHPPSPEEHSVQLISQKSIEQALDHFTRESKDQQHQHQPSPLAEKRVLFDAQKPEVTNIIMDSDRQIKPMKETSVVGDIKLKRQNHDVIETVKDPHARHTQKINVTRLDNWIEDDSRQDSLTNGDSADNGYELLLKLPNGKKVFLKEASHVVYPPEKKKTPKEVLKEAITKGKLKKNTIQQYPVFKPDKVPIPANPNVVVLPPSVKYVQGMLAMETTARAQILAVVNPTKEAKIVRAIKVSEMKKETKPKKIAEKAKDNEKEQNQINEKDKDKVREIEKESPIKETKTKINSTKTVDDKDRSAMAMAGRRYRRRKTETYKMLVEQNRKLQSDNEAMSRQLISSMIEIKRLRELINVHHSSVANKQQVVKGFSVHTTPKIFWMADTDTNPQTVLNRSAKAAEK